MQLATVTDVYCGNAAKIDRQWHVDGQSGNTIKFKGISAPAPLTPAGRTAEAYMVLILSGTQIEIGGTYGVSAEGHLRCDVYGNESNRTAHLSARYLSESSDGRCPECGFCGSIKV